MSVQPRIDPTAELERAFRILVEHWILALPTAVASLVTLLLIVSLVISTVGSIIGVGVLGSHHPIGALSLFGAAALWALAALAAVMVISLLAHAMVVHAAEDPWAGRPVNLATSLAVSIGKLPALIVAGFAIFCLMLIPVALSFVLVGLPLVLVVAYFLIYVLPAIVIGNESGAAAIGTSFRLTRDNLGPSLVCAIAMLVVIAVAQGVSIALGHIPLLGWAGAFVIGGLGQAYAALISARFYMLLRGMAPGASLTQTVP